MVDYPLGAPPSHAEISEGSITLAAEETYQLTFRLVANNGTSIPADWTWSSMDESIATVNNDGLVSGIGKGQTWIEGIAEMEFKDSVLVNVTSDLDDVASVTISGDDSNMEVDDTRQLTAVVRTGGGDIVEADVSWSTSNASVVSVGSNGLVTAESEGTASITARAEGVSSEPFAITVGSNVESRSGEFSGRNGYNASGTATLEVSGDDAVLKFSSDFSTQNGPGLYIYLSTKDNSVQGGLELGQIQSTSGAQEYPLPPGSDPSPYDHVIIYCKPFGVLFGVATFE